MEHPFTTYVRTKNVFKNRLKDLKDYGTVKIYVYELNKLGFNSGPLLYKLKERGEIWYDKVGNFKALREGPINPVLLERTKKRVRERMMLTPLHKWMMKQLMYVELDVPKNEMPVYFKAFLDHRSEQLDAFFTVDGFSNRVHSPVVNLKGNLRLSLKFYGERMASLDVKQMQPTILAKVLDDAIGKNSFSDAIWRGEDVYMHLLQQNAVIKTRPEAKKLLFQLIFGKPKNDIGKMFHGNTNWVDWINAYKSRTEHKNPHKEDMHTNLAWLLQYSEVMVMSDIWRALKGVGIPFLTIHDDVLCKESDKDQVYVLMEKELEKHFKTFDINIDHSES